LFFSFLFIIEQLFFSLYSWNESLLGAVIGFGMLYLLCIISGGGIGGGDIKLYGIIGFVLGVQGVILSFMIACIIGSCAGIVGMMLGRIKRGVPIPFVPFICVGTLSTAFFQEEIISLYIHFFSF